MHGREPDQKQLLTVVSLEDRIPSDHPVRRLKAVTDEALAEILPGLRALYAEGGRKSVPPEYLLRALVLQVVFSIRSERQLVEQLQYNLMFRWFVGLDLDEDVWDATTFTKNRQRLLDSDAGQAFLISTFAVAQRKGLLQDDRFVVDGTLVKAYASMGSFRKKDDEDEPPKGGTAKFYGMKRSNQTHESKTDKDAKLMRKGPGKETMLCHLASVIVHAASGLVQGCRVGVITEDSEVDHALAMAPGLPLGSILAADKGYDCGKFRSGCRESGVTGHPIPKAKHPAVDGRTTRHASFKQSMKERPLVEKAFAWLKSEGRLRQTRFRGRPKVGLSFELGCAAHNLLKLAYSRG